MDKERFDELVANVVSNLPKEFMSRLENVEVLVEDFPTSAQLRRSGLRSNKTLLGVYEGVPHTRRTAGYNMVLPDKITIFQKAIEASCRNEQEIPAVIESIVKHEIAHHFGISDDRLRELGRY